MDTVGLLKENKMFGSHSCLDFKPSVSTISLLFILFLKQLLSPQMDK